MLLAIATTSIFIVAGVVVAQPASADTTRSIASPNGSSASNSDPDGQGPVVTADSRELSVTSSSGSVTAEITQPGLRVQNRQISEKAILAAGNLIATDSEEMLTTATKSTLIQTSSVASGMQTLIVISDSTAANSVTFDLDVAPGLTPKLTAEGAIDYVDKAGLVVAGIKEPWAKDANGNSIPSSFALVGDKLTQYIGFTSSSVFPVIADPEWWQIAISAAAGAAVGAAVVVLIPGVGPTIGAIVGGCVAGALNALWDKKGFWGAFWGCAVGAAVGAVSGMVGSIVKNVLRARGIRGL